MDQSFHEWSQSVSDGHQQIGWFEPVHVDEEISGELFVGEIVESITADYTEYEQEKEEDGGTIEEFLDEVVALRNGECSETKESEVLNIILEDEVDKYKPEWVGSEVLADFVVE